MSRVVWRTDAPVATRLEAAHVFELDRDVKVAWVDFDAGTFRTLEPASPLYLIRVSTVLDGTWEIVECSPSDSRCVS